jgi:hypothetical protein
MKGNSATATATATDDVVDDDETEDEDFQKENIQTTIKKEKKKKKKKKQQQQQQQQKNHVNSQSSDSSKKSTTPQSGRIRSPNFALASPKPPPISPHGWPLVPPQHLPLGRFEISNWKGNFMFLENTTGKVYCADHAMFTQTKGDAFLLVSDASGRILLGTEDHRWVTISRESNDLCISQGGFDAECKVTPIYTQPLKLIYPHSTLASLAQQASSTSTPSRLPLRTMGRTTMTSRPEELSTLLCATPPQACG